MFSRGQQGQFRPLVRRAWLAECKVCGWDSTDAAAEREWYEDELEHATGKRSTRDCDVKRDFEDAMRHFEIIEGASIYWQMQWASGDARRILHEVRELAPEFECGEKYMLGIASQELRRPVTAWRELEGEDLVTVIRALKIQVRRQRRRGDLTDKPRREADPF